VSGSVSQLDGNGARWRWLGHSRLIPREQRPVPRYVCEQGVHHIHLWGNIACSPGKVIPRLHLGELRGSQHSTISQDIRSYYY